MTDHRLYAALWRWHFYAALFVLPFVLVLSVTGAVYLFKPQIDRWEEAPYRGLGTAGAVSADRQLQAALTAFPGLRFNYYRLPEQAGDAAMVQLGGADGSQLRVYVSPQGKVLGWLDQQARITEVVGRLHGSLLLGKWGDRLVELAAGWTIVMILSGLCLWWPRPFHPAGTLYPRLALRGRALFKDLHRVGGFWIAGLVLVMLVSGLPWAGAWGANLEWVREELGLIQGPRNWKIGAEAVVPIHDHDHDRGAAAPIAPSATGLLPLAAFVAKAEQEQLAFPVQVLPPHAPQRFGPPTGNVWTVQSDSQNRWLRTRVSFDPDTAAEVDRTGFSDLHVIDRIVNTGITWHEGQLFGLANQLMGLLTAIVLIAISIFGVLMWLRRRPRGRLGAPPASGVALAPWVIAVLVVLGLFQPLFGISLLLLAVLDRLAFAG